MHKSSIRVVLTSLLIFIDVHSCEIYNISNYNSYDYKICWHHYRLERLKLVRCEKILPRHQDINHHQNNHHSRENEYPFDGFEEERHTVRCKCVKYFLSILLFKVLTSSIIVSHTLYPKYTIILWLNTCRIISKITQLSSIESSLALYLLLLPELYLIP